MPNKNRTAIKARQPWNVENRSTTHLLFRFLGNDPGGIIAIYHRMYPNFDNQGGYTYYHLLDQWRDRFTEKRRTADYIIIDRPNPWDQSPYTAAELGRFAVLRDVIRDWARVLNINIVLPTSHILLSGTPPANPTHIAISPSAGALVHAPTAPFAAPVVPATVSLSTTTTAAVTQTAASGNAPGTVHRTRRLPNAASGCGHQQTPPKPSSTQAEPARRSSRIPEQIPICTDVNVDDEIASQSDDDVAPASDDETPGARSVGSKLTLPSLIVRLPLPQNKLTLVALAQNTYNKSGFSISLSLGHFRQPRSYPRPALPASTECGPTQFQGATSDTMVGAFHHQPSNAPNDPTLISMPAPGTYQSHAIFPNFASPHHMAANGSSNMLSPNPAIPTAADNPYSDKPFTWSNLIPKHSELRNKAAPGTYMYDSYASDSTNLDTKSRGKSAIRKDMVTERESRNLIGHQPDDKSSGAACTSPHQGILSARAAGVSMRGSKRPAADGDTDYEPKKKQSIKFGRKVTD